MTHRQPGDVPVGSVRVRLLTRPDWQPLAEFQLAEAELANRIHRADRGTHEGTVACMAAEVGWAMTQVTPAQAHAIAAAGFWPPEYAQQVDELRRASDARMLPGDVVEVTRASGARSVWWNSGLGMELIQRQSAAAAQRAAAGLPPLSSLFAESNQSVEPEVER